MEYSDGTNSSVFIIKSSLLFVTFSAVAYLATSIMTVSLLAETAPLFCSATKNSFSIGLSEA